MASELDFDRIMGLLEELRKVEAQRDKALRELAALKASCSACRERV